MIFPSCTLTIFTVENHSRKIPNTETVEYFYCCICKSLTCKAKIECIIIIIIIHGLLCGDSLSIERAVGLITTRHIPGIMSICVMYVPLEDRKNVWCSMFASDKCTGKCFVRFIFGLLSAGERKKFDEVNKVQYRVNIINSRIDGVGYGN